MGVYINKAELLKELSVIQDRPVSTAMKIIKELSTIDLVRCRECARRKKNGFCLEHNRYERNDDGFCNYGERRADEGTTE